MQGNAGSTVPPLMFMILIIPASSLKPFSHPCTFEQGLRQMESEDADEPALYLAKSFSFPHQAKFNKRIDISHEPDLLDGDIGARRMLLFVRITESPGPD